ncbi:LADA_0F04654g1_1 [Lachancea dasiensis]|uniref:LADA_0F04654g1_1 n=1 Tax=Lachancea dasiensis TaxID=1072105 RepID=A0A1G4JJC4_9SACH|nr:LADA_0F04654g1_1 [Lachancea dasiensis]
MKLKLIINGPESPEDYKLLKSTISTVASLRKTAVLRFTSERLVIVSTPTSTASSSSILYADKGQLWCTIPRDVFSSYEVVSARDLNTITMECSCDVLQNIFKKYDKSISLGNEGIMTIKLQSMPEWNTNVLSNVDSKNPASSGSKVNPVCALGVTFEEVISTDIDANTAVKMGGVIGSGSTKTISHSFKVPTRLLFRAQDAKIQEPMINYTQLMMYRLPSPRGEWGRGFASFIRRIERYSNVHNIKLSGNKFWQNNDGRVSDHEFKIVVNELDWYLEICWNGPLDAMVPPQGADEEPADPPAVQPEVNDEVQVEETHEQSLFIEESFASENLNSADSGPNGDEDSGKAEVSVRGPDVPSKHEVVIRTKDWKVCSKLYEAFEEIVLAISYDESCVFHCTLPRGNIEDQDGERPREHGQVIYYMARARKI